MKRIYITAVTGTNMWLYVCNQSAAVLESDSKTGQTGFVHQMMFSTKRCEEDRLHLPVRGGRTENQSKGSSVLCY